ncbi:hypothetical protein [uncultured Nocardioides sp.]|uniref:hypothetical protein n=1 Tax=uncultured Nocardioides sp. TaxID=198441 RepID=UPI00263959EA|nr:hypothetical protein [uncultured Nocardioides sp.]
MTNKVVSAADAAALIQTGDTLTTSGFVGIGVPDELLAALEARFLETGQPRDLGLVFAAGQGDGKSRGLNRLGHEGLLRRVVGGHWGLIPKVAALAVAGATPRASSTVAEVTPKPMPSVPSTSWARPPARAKAATNHMVSS